MKKVLRWGILAAAIAFLIHNLMVHWGEVTHLRLRPGGLAMLALAFGVTLLAHTLSGWVWSWILDSLQHPISGLWSTLVYLRTNVWKYLPGNVWHFVGRVRALKTLTIPTGTAVAGVVLEPVLMAAAALMLGLLSSPQYRLVQLVGLAVLLALLHPRCLNPVIVRLSRAKARSAEATITEPIEGLAYYPLKPLAGEFGFVLLRGMGFGLAVLALSPVGWDTWPLLLSRFSLAWGLGLVVPGAPGGLGIFEAAAVSLLQGQFSAGVVLGTVALYRLISTLAEAAGYGLALLLQQLYPHWIDQPVGK